MSSDTVRSFTVCHVDDLKNGEIREFPLAEEGLPPILLVKESDNEFYAIGGKCSHYGAPLAKGAYCNGRVRCPWHGACFNVKTGDIEEHPGLDSLPRFKVRIADQQVSVEGSVATFMNAKRVKPMARCSQANRDTVAIVGGGASGLSCAETLRQEGFTGRIVIITQERSLPYDRPKLSKTLAVNADAIALRSQDFYREHDIEVLLNKKVTGIDTKRNQVLIFDGAETVPYQHLVLATGGMPRGLTVPGNNLQNICYLRTPTDSQKINNLSEGKHVVIIGSSFIGLELASTIAKHAASITIVDVLPSPFQNVFSAKIGLAVKQLFEANGVKFQLGIPVKELRGKAGWFSEVVLQDGTVVPGDICIAGIGVNPSTDFLKFSTVKMDDRGFVPVDDRFRTTQPNVYACGDIVLFPLATYQNQVVNVQHWQMATKHGNAVAHAILEKPTSMKTVPFFWTVMFGKSIRYAGYGFGFEEVIVHGDLDKFVFVAYYLKEDRLVAVASVMRDPVASQLAEVFYNGTVVTKQDIEKNPSDNWQHLLQFPERGGEADSVSISTL